MVRHRLVSGLLESLALLPRSLAPPCTPFVEGRQRAAPHSSSFPLTTAPLQTLHLDVWGPSPVLGPRQERYFLIVVDDSSRYTTVFPLRRKADVPTILKLWLLARGGAQGLCGLRLHSDRGGEFSSTCLETFCQGRGIIHAYALPDSPQQKGVAERRIGLVMEVSRTSMCLAGAPQFLWPQAPPQVAPVAPPPSRLAPSGVSHVTSQSSPPQRPVLVVSGGAGGAIAEGEGTGAAGARGASSGGVGGVRVETTLVEDTAVLTQRPCPASPPGFPSVPQFPPRSPPRPVAAEPGVCHVDVAAAAVAAVAAAPVAAAAAVAATAVATAELVAATAVAATAALATATAIAISCTISSIGCPQRTTSSLGCHHRSNSSGRSSSSGSGSSTGGLNCSSGGFSCSACSNLHSGALMDPSSTHTGASEVLSVGAAPTTRLVVAGSGATSPTAQLSFTLDSGVSTCFFCDCTDLTPLHTPVTVALADPSVGPVVANSTTTLPCLAAPSGFLIGYYTPSFSRNLVGVSHLHDLGVVTTFLLHEHVASYTVGATGAPLTTFHREPGSGLYSLHTGSEPLAPLPRSSAPPCIPCVEGRQRAAPHSSSFPPTTAPLQTLHLDVWGPSPVLGPRQERYFLIVVDDYSRYTTVFPLRRKADVPTILEPWLLARGGV
ncbi:unnamed protein product [Closterium sp. NIES-53]